MVASDTYKYFFIAGALAFAEAGITTGVGQYVLDTNLRMTFSPATIAKEGAEKMDQFKSTVEDFQKAFKSNDMEAATQLRIKASDQLKQLARLADSFSTVSPSLKPTRWAKAMQSSSVAMAKVSFRAAVDTFLEPLEIQAGSSMLATHIGSVREEAKRALAISNPNEVAAGLEYHAKMTRRMGKISQVAKADIGLGAVLTAGPLVALPFILERRSKMAGIDLSWKGAMKLQDYIFIDSDGKLILNSKSMKELFSDKKKSREIFSKYPKLCDAMIRVNESLKEDFSKFKYESLTCKPEISYEANTSRGVQKYRLTVGPKDEVHFYNEKARYSLKFTEDVNDTMIWTDYQPADKSMTLNKGATISEMARTYAANTSSCQKGEVSGDSKIQCLVGEDVQMNTYLVNKAIKECHEKARGSNSGNSPVLKEK